MDFKSMKRKELQALCKEHGLPANTTNSQMIENLSSIFKENIKIKGCLKGSGRSSAQDLGILRGVSKKVTFEFQASEESGFEESTVQPVGKSKRKSIGRRFGIAPELEKRSTEIEKGSHSETVKNVAEVSRRSTRSQGLAEAILWSPVIEKKKKLGDGTEGVRQNAESVLSKGEGIFGEVPVTRSLRNRIVVVGAAEELVTDQNLRTQKRKSSDKKEGDEKVAAAVVEKDEPVGMKSLRKRSRNGNSVENEPCRRSSRNLARLEETVATEEVDVGRPKKRRKGVIDASANEIVVDQEFEKVTKSGHAVKRSRGNELGANAMELVDVNDVAGLKKARSQGKNHDSKPGDPTVSMLDNEAVTGPTRRSTRSSSALLEGGNSVSAVVKSDQEGEAAGKGKSQKQEKDCASKGRDSASILLGREVVAEPVRRSTRSSSTLLLDGTSLPVVGKSVKEAEVVRKGRKGKSQMQAKDDGSKRGGSTTSLQDSEVVAEPLQRSTHTSLTLLEDGTSLPVVGKSVRGGGVVRKGKLRKQAKNHGYTGGGDSTTSLPESEVIVEPVRRSTRSFSSLLENGTSLPVDGKSVKEGEAVRKEKSRKQGKNYASEGGSTASLSDDGVRAEPTRRLTHSSSKLLEDESHSPAVGKLGGDHEAVRNDNPGKLQKDHASKHRDSLASLSGSEAFTTPTKRSTRSSSKLLGDDTLSEVVGKSGGQSNTVKKDDLWKQTRDHTLEGGDSTTSLPDNRAVTTPTRRSTRSSSKLLEEETLLKVETLGGDNEIGKSKSGKRSENRALKLGGSTDPLLENKAVMTSARRSARSTSKLSENGTLPVDGKSVKEGEAVRKGKSQKQGKNHASEGGSTASLSDDGVRAEPTRSLTHSSSKLLEDESHSPAVRKLGGDHEAVRNDNTGKLQRDHASKHRDSLASLSGSEAFATPTKRSTRSSSKLLGDDTFSEVVGKSGGQSDMVRRDDSWKQPKDHTLEQGDSTTSLLDNRAVTTPTRRPTQSSSKLLEEETLLKVETLGGDNEIGKSKSGKRSENRALKLGGSTAPVLENKAVMTSARRSTRSTSKLSEDGISLEIGKLGHDNEAMRKENLGKKSKNSAFKQGENIGGFDGRGALEVSSNSSQRKSLRKVPADSEVVQRQCLPDTASSLLEDIQEDSHLKGKSTQKNCSNVKQSSCMQEREIDTKGTTIGYHMMEEQNVLSGNKVEASKSSAAIDIADEISVQGPPSIALPFELSIAVESACGRTEVSNDVEDKIISEMRQSPANVQLQKIENDTSLVGALKDLDDMCVGSYIKEKKSSFTEMANKGRGELPLNFLEGSSEIQENISGELGCSTVYTDAEGALESYGDDRGKTLAPVEFTASNMKADVRETSVGVLDDGDGLAGMESQNITSSPAVPLLSSSELSTTFHTEISAIACFKESDSAVEVDVASKDIMRDYGGTQVTAPPLPCRSFHDQSLTSDTEASPGHALEDSNLGAKIRGATEDGLLDNEAADICETTLVCESSEKLSPTSDTDPSPEIDLEEPESKVKEDGPSEDVTAGSGATETIYPVTSDTEVCPEAFSDINVEESDSKVDVHVASKGGMEGTEATNTVGSPLSCKSTGVLSPSLLPNLLNEASPDIVLTEPDLEVETQAKGKTLEVSMAADGDVEDSSKIQRLFYDDMESGEADPDNILSAQLAAGECDAEKNIEPCAGDSDSQSCEVDMQVIKETWVSSTLSFTVNCGIETEDDKNEDEPGPSSPSDNPAIDLSSGDHLKGHGTQSSPKDIVDGATSLCSHGKSATQSNFSQSLYDKDPADVEGNSRNSYDDTFCKNNSSCFLSPITFVKPEGQSYVLPMDDHVSPHSKIAVMCSEITKGQSSVKHRSSSQGLLASSKSVKQMEKGDILHGIDVESTVFSTLSNDNPSRTAAVLFGDNKKDVDAGYLPHSPVPLTCGEGNFPISSSGTPTALAYEGSTKQLCVQDFRCVPDSEDARHLSDQHEVELNVTESLVVDSMDRNPKSEPEEHEALEQLNEVADIPSETVNSVNEPTDVEFQRSLELGVVDAKEMEKVESLESVVNIECDNVTLTKNADSIGLDKFDHFDEIGQQQDEAFLLQEVKCSSVELHTDDVTSQQSLENSASMPGEERVLSLENFDSSTCMENASSGIYLVDSHKFCGESNDGEKVGAKMESRLPSNVCEGIDNQQGLLAALRKSSEKERSQFSPIKSKSVLESREKHTELSTPWSMYPIPADSSKSREAGLYTRCSSRGGSTKSVDKPEEGKNLEKVYFTAVSEPQSEDADNANNDKDVQLEEISDYNTITASTKIAEGEHGIDDSINMSIPGMVKDYGVTGISEDNEAPPVGDQSLVGSEKLVELGSREYLAMVVTDSSTEAHTQDEESNKYQGTLECFEQAPNVEEAWVAPGTTLMFEEDLFPMDSDVSTFVKDSQQVGPWVHHEENLAHGECGKVYEINTAETVAITEGKMKATGVSGSSDAESREASPYECEMSAKAENFSGGSAKPCVGVDSEATHCSEQSEGHEERRIPIRETSEVSKSDKNEMFSVLFGTKIEGSATMLSKSEKIEITQIPTIAKHEELIASNCTELSRTNIADQVVLWDWKDGSGTEEGRSIGNELEDSKLRETFAAQCALVSPDTGTVEDSSAVVQEESIVSKDSKDEMMAPEEYFEWSFSDTVDVGSSHHAVREVDSLLHTGSIPLNSADHSEKSGIDVNEEQNKSSNLHQIEDSEECVQSTPMQFVRNVKACSVIDDVIRNKENTVGLKMDSTVKNNEKSKISNSSRQPLQSVRSVKDH